MTAATVATVGHIARATRLPVTGSLLEVEEREYRRRWSYEKPSSWLKCRSTSAAVATAAAAAAAAFPFLGHESKSARREKGGNGAGRTLRLLWRDRLTESALPRRETAWEDACKSRSHGLIVVKSRKRIRDGVLATTRKNRPRMDDG